jgi:hypothetical protein
MAFALPGPSSEFLLFGFNSLTRLGKTEKIVDNIFGLLPSYLFGGIRLRRTCVTIINYQSVCIT